ncbi:MAG: PilZ domain-containing protein [Candidatus Omnitrophica bacterium]|nr:PilZ domain-containing protein [Candidatus Omnitrophota bacterium]
MEDRRRAKRVAEYVPVSYRIPPGPKIENFLTRDISTSGVRIFVKEFMNKGTVLELTISLKKIPYSFNTQGQVRWISKDPSGERYEAGVEFINIPKEAKEKLQFYIEEYLNVDLR